MSIRMQQRRGTATVWLANDPILAPGEIGIESDTNKFKIGDGINVWSELDYFSTSIDLSQYATHTEVTSAINALISSAPTALDTINELAAALGDDANYAATVTTALSNKQDKVPGVSDTEIGYLDGVTSNIQTQIDNAGPSSTSVSSNITLAKGKYFVDTSSALTLTLPATPSLGDEIQVFDATGTAETNNITVANNSAKINGVLDSALLDTNGVAAVFVYTGSTYGWRMG
jgi:hypothetical protein